jgi:Predicted GTPase, probable translation factor
MFDSDDIQNVNPTVDPVRDLEIIETEMKLADLESIQKRLEKKNKKNLDNEEVKMLETAQKIIDEDGDLKIINEFDEKLLKKSGLLINKPKLYVCNVDEESINSGNKYTKDFITKFGEKNTLIISADIENQINQLENEGEKKNYMKMINMSETGLNSLIKKGYELLSLQTFFTSGPEESRAWTITKNSTAPKAAGEIHTDFQKGFIRAETISYEDFIKNNGWTKSKEAGKMRLEGKDYIVKDGDILNFRFNT